MESEGVRFSLHSGRIDDFLEAEMARLKDNAADLRWHRNQMLRYIVQRRAKNMGINGYEARRAAELVVIAADGRSEERSGGTDWVSRCRFRWSVSIEKKKNEQ